MINQIEKIVKDAEERLDRFYKAYGETGKKGSKPNQNNLIKNTEPKKETNQKNFFEGPPPRIKIISRLSSNNGLVAKDTTNEKIESNISSQPEPPIVLSSQKQVSFDNLKSKEVIQLVKDLTGITIKVCVKSKKNVIRHATITLESKGFSIKSGI